MTVARLIIYLKKKIDHLVKYIRKFDHRLWILSGGWIASAAGFSISIPFIAIYFHSELGMDLTTIGLFFGFTAIVRATTQAAAGELSDRMGRYPLMVVSQLIRSLVFFVTAVAVYLKLGFFPVGGLLILNSIFGAIFQPSAQAAVADLAKFNERSEAYAITRVAGNFGWAIGPAIGGFMAAKSYAILFIVSGFMTLISGLIIGIFLRGIKPKEHNNVPFRIKDILSYKGNELIIRHAAFVFILYLVFAQLIAPFSLYSVSLMGLPESRLGILFTLNGLLVTIFQLPTTRLMNRYRLTTQLFVGAIVYGAGYFLVGFAATFTFFIIAMVIITLGENCISPPALTLTANLAPEGRTGRYMGIYGFAVTFGWSMGPLIGTTLLDWTEPNYIYMWAIIALMAVISSLGFKTMSKRIPRELDRPNQ